MFKKMTKAQLIDFIHKQYETIYQLEGRLERAVEEDEIQAFEKRVSEWDKTHKDQSYRIHFLEHKVSSLDMELKKAKLRLENKERQFIKAKEEAKQDIWSDVFDEVIDVVPDVERLHEAVDRLYKKVEEYGGWKNV